MTAACHWGCGESRPHQLRPYGPGGAWVCVPCTFDEAHPERKQTFEGAFSALLEGSAAVSDIGVAAIGRDNGPVPVMRSDLDRPPAE